MNDWGHASLQNSTIFNPDDNQPPPHAISADTTPITPSRPTHQTLCCNLQTPPLPYIQVTLHDTPVRALIDSGAAMSIVQHAFFNQSQPHNTSLTSSAIELVGPNNVSIKTFGKTKLELILNSESLTLDVIVADISQLLILGNDFLQKYGIKLDFQRKILTTSIGSTLPVMNIHFNLQEQLSNCLTQQ